MKKLIYTAILLSAVCLVESCKSPSDPVSASSQPTDQDINARTGVQSYSSAVMKSIIENNLVDKSLKSDYEVRQGILHFKDLDTYLKVRNELGKLSVPERITKTKIPGFISLLALYQEFIDKSDKNESTESYKDIIVQVNKESSNEYKQEFLNTDITVAALINRNGLVYIGKILYRFTDKYEEYVLDGDQSKLGTTNQLVQKFDSDVTLLTKGARVAAGDFCGQSWRAKNSTDGQRRIALDVKIRSDRYVTGSTTVGGNTTDVYRWEVQPTAFGVPYKKPNPGSWSWDNYRTTNHLKSAWNFSVARSDNQQVLSCYDNYEYWNDWNWIDYGGTILTFYNVPGKYAYNGGIYNTQVIPTFQFDGGYYYTDGVPEAQKLLMICP